MARIIDLQDGELLRIDAKAGTRVQVLFGAIWLTEPLRLDDVFAASGDEVTLDHGGRVLVEAQGFARVIVAVSTRQPAFAGLLAQLRKLARRPVPAPTHAIV
ncbi:MAG: DUF2917 domain-containing protein [Burkholderiales bacterium]|jgi:hypothetical protein|nr:DUF2917 domain-containing protein [Burkholderiales bacterium]